MPDDVRPNPDPTALTNAALAEAERRMLIEVSHLRDWTTAKIDSIEQIRIVQIMRLEQLRDCKFAEIDTRFSERDLRFAQQDRDHQTALNAALTSASQQLNQLMTLQGTLKDATDQRMKSIETIVARIDGSRIGADQGFGRTIALIAVLVSILTAVVTYVHFLPGPPTILAPTK